MLPLNTNWAAAKSHTEGQSPKWNNVTQSRVSAGYLAGCGGTLIRAGCGKDTTSVVPISPLKWFAL